MRGLEDMGHRDGDERGGDEARLVLVKHADREEEHHRGDQGAQRRDHEVEGPAELQPAKGGAGDEEEHPWKVRVRDAPSRIREGDVAGL